MKPAGDQPEAIKQLVAGVESGSRFQTLLGVTGSGKTFTAANVIAKINKPTLVIAHNKTLAAQLCNEFREFFPNNVVEYFVSYYDYYQPEAYMPSSDTYIEKEATINEEIDRLRHATTQALLTRKDVIIVASVSCIYGLGAPETYEKMHLRLDVGQPLTRAELLRHLVRIQYTRTTSDLKRGMFRARGDVYEIMPISEEVIVRVECDDKSIREILIVDPVTRKTIESRGSIWIFPAKHFITPEDDRERAVNIIQAELKHRLEHFNAMGKLLEAERLERRVNNDMAMLREVGYCHGIENYSQPLSGRPPGAPPDTLLAYFPKDFLCIIDESHVTVPQVQGMFNGDQARKRTLIDYGFRLPSAADNRPLQFHEFLERVPQMIFVSATPGPYERQVSTQVVEQVIRPTGLVDPKITVLPVTPGHAATSIVDRGSTETDEAGVMISTQRDPNYKGQVEDLIGRIVTHVADKERVLVTTLTKKMAEDLTDFLTEKKIKVQYLHSDVVTLDRIKIITDFRRGKYDVLVGVNLLREGLDLPEVTLVAILDADKEGFLRSETSLIQTIGRAARNVKGEVILYADEITPSMSRAMKETERRRAKQLAYNKEHGITPRTIQKVIKDIMEGLEKDEDRVKNILALENKAETHDIKELLKDKEAQMREAAKNLEFELAALLRDEIALLSKQAKKSTVPKKIKKER